MRPHENRLLIPLLIILMFIAFSLPLAAGQWEEPSQILLTWQNDPTKTMTITWRADVKNADSLVYYSQDEDPVKEGKRKEAKTFSFEETEALLHTAELTGLEPNTKYRTIVETAGEGSKEFLFRTAPAESRNISFVLGGDSRTNREYRRKINQKVAHENPDFVLFTGDLVDNGLSESQWNAWFDDWHELMVTEDGRRIPLIPAIGNHELPGTFYYNRIPLPEQEKYYSLEYGPDLNLLTLDSGHTSEIDGPQLKWLEDTLTGYGEDEWIIAQQHIPAWPSYKDFFGDISTGIRNNWVPLFEEYGVDLVHEADNHTYKRTEFLHGSDRIESYIDEFIEQEMKRAEREFDPEEDYSPWAREQLQKLSAGDYEEAGYDEDELLSAMEALAFEYSLYAKQQSHFSHEYVRELIEDSDLYLRYWREIGEAEEFEDLISEEKGIVYIGDGGWGAPIRELVPPEEWWWLKDAAGTYHYWSVKLLAEEEKLEVQPHFYYHEEDEWASGEKFTIEK